MWLAPFRILAAGLLLISGADLAWAQQAQQPTAQPEITPEERARKVLADGAGDRDPEVRREVAVALSLISTRDVSAALLDTLVQDRDHLVREAAIASIGDLGDKTRVPALKAALEDEVPEVVFAAARTLYRMGEPEGRDVLLSIVEQETKAKSGFIRDKLRAVVRRMKTPKSALLFSVQQGAGFVPVPGLGGGISAMSGILSDADFSARASALLMLSKDKSTPARQAIEDGLLDNDWSVRAAAIQILAQGGLPVYRRPISQLFNDNNRKVRFRAAAAYLRLDYLARRSAPKKGPKK